MPNLPSLQPLFRAALKAYEDIRKPTDESRGMQLLVKPLGSLIGYVDTTQAKKAALKKLAEPEVKESPQSHTALNESMAELKKHLGEGDHFDALYSILSKCHSLYIQPQSSSLMTDLLDLDKPRFVLYTALGQNSLTHPLFIELGNFFKQMESYDRELRAEPSAKEEVHGASEKNSSQQPIATDPSHQLTVSTEPPEEFIDVSTLKSPRETAPVPSPSTTDEYTPAQRSRPPTPSPIIEVKAEVNAATEIPSSSPSDPQNQQPLDNSPSLHSVSLSNSNGENTAKTDDSDTEDDDESVSAPPITGSTLPVSLESTPEESAATIPDPIPGTPSVNSQPPAAESDADTTPHPIATPTDSSSEQKATIPDPIPGTPSVNSQPSTAESDADTTPHPIATPTDSSSEQQAPQSTAPIGRTSALGMLGSYKNLNLALNRQRDASSTAIRQSNIRARIPGPGQNTTGGI